MRTFPTKDPQAARILPRFFISLLTVALAGEQARALPDLVPEISDPAVRVGNVGAGDVAEGCAGGTLNRRLVRYTVAARNISNEDLIIGDPGCPMCSTNPGAPCTNPLYICSTAHGHAHMESFMQADLRDLDGNLVAAGRKYSFCLGDVDCAAPKYHCGFQGITAGCADIYTADTACQYIDITGVAIPAGTYMLHTTVDPDNVFPEANDSNNTAQALIFIGAPPTCPVYEATDLPKPIPDLGSVTSTITIAAEGEVTNVQVVDLLGNHSFVGNLEMRLTSPQGTSVTLVNRICGSNDNFHVSLQDLAETAPPCPPTDGQYHTSAQPLSAFDGEPASGTWTLTIFDRASSNIGTLQGWALAICTQSTCPIYPSAAVPKLVPAPGSTASALNVPVSGRIVDVNLVHLNATQAAVSDWDLRLVSPGGTEVVVLDRVCATSLQLALSLDDAAAGAIACPADSGSAFRPSAPLAAFNGEDAAGAWHLIAIDRSRGNVRMITAWGLQLCTDSACATYAATNLPLTIPDLGMAQASVSVPVNASVTDVNVLSLAGSHPQLSDLQFRLTSPSGTETLLAGSLCSNSGAYTFGLDDSAPSPLPCPPNDGMLHTPATSLDSFDDEIATGLWVLTAADTQAQNWGDLSAFALQLCTDAALPTSPTPTFVATPSPTPTTNVDITVQTTAAVAGGIACVSTVLEANGSKVGETQTELTVEPEDLVLIDCTISPIIGPGSAYDRQLTSLPAGATVDLQVTTSANDLPLPGGSPSHPGQLHTCRYTVDPDATGATAVTVQASVTAVSGSSLPVATTGAAVTLSSCSGDCNGNGDVELSELILCINRFLGAPACDVIEGKHCAVADANADGNVSIGEMVRCVTDFLEHCN